ncbi:MAG: SUMF1/EgtB/PvdO family nonheme iron enzyme [Phycisphaerales bacterium]|nr:MAG: SUMF1/EgtB/PvdO family nonheme iron enzyme [Phycisphaerales bacterium]
MRRKSLIGLISLIVVSTAGSFCLGGCRSSTSGRFCWVFQMRGGDPNAPAIFSDMAYIPGGIFDMGDDSCYSGHGGCDRRFHTVMLNSFLMGTYEITNQQYCDYLNSALSRGLIRVTDGIVYQAGSGTSYPYCDTHGADSWSQIDFSEGVFSVRSKSGRSMGNDPMVMVTWFGAAAYCNWRSQQEGKEQCYSLSTWSCDFSKKGYRLPTEAEWEYERVCVLSGRRRPRQEMRYVVDWCNDWYLFHYYLSSPATNPTGAAAGTSRVIRGGKVFPQRIYDERFLRWHTLDFGYYNYPISTMNTYRYHANPSYRECDVGFRLVLDL